MTTLGVEGVADHFDEPLPHQNTVGTDDLAGNPFYILTKTIIVYYAPNFEKVEINWFHFVHPSVCPFQKIFTLGF